MEFVFDVGDLVTVKACLPRVADFDNLVGLSFRNGESVADERAAGAHFADDLFP